MQCSFALSSRKWDGICGDVIQSSARQQSIVLFIAEKKIMANVSKLIFGAAIAAASIATPALAAHKGKPISTYHNGYVTRSSQGGGVYDFVSPPTDRRSWVGDPAGRPYVYVPGSAEGP
jgi:hypothetical protein